MQSFLTWEPCYSILKKQFTFAAYQIMQNSILTLFVISAHRIHIPLGSWGIWTSYLLISSFLCFNITVTEWLNNWHYLLSIFTFLSGRCQLERNVNNLKNRWLQDRKLAYCPTWSQVYTLSFGVFWWDFFPHEIVLVS